MDPPEVVLVGQRPPPIHGQALAIDRLVRGQFTRIKIRHVPMDFSAAMEEVGRVTLRKIGRLFRLIWRVLRIRVRTRAQVLYYPPAGPSLVPVIRDIVFLIAVKPFFPTVVLDFHAGGLEDMEDRLHLPLRFLFRRAYHNPELAIYRYPSDSKTHRLPAKRTIVVPYGIDDEFPRLGSRRSNGPGFTVLYVGLVSRSKGAWTLVEAVSLLKHRGLDIHGVVVGEFGSEGEESEWHDLIRAEGLETRVRYTGRLVGDDKWQEFRDADVFCFPSYYENEAFPIVLIEAMQFGLPVVASDWRGIPHLVQEGVTGLLVPPRNALAVADCLEQLAKDPELRAEMGEAGRRSYLERYTVRAYLSAMEEALHSVGGEEGPDRKC